MGPVTDISLADRNREHARRTLWEGGVAHPSWQQQVVLLCLIENTSHAAYKLHWLNSKHGRTAIKAASGRQPRSTVKRHCWSPSARKAGNHGEYSVKGVERPCMCDTNCNRQLIQQYVGRDRLVMGLRVETVIWSACGFALHGKGDPKLLWNHNCSTLIM